MTNRRKNRLWISPSLYGSVIILTGGTLRDYGIPNVMYVGLCRYEYITGNLYPFNPESRTKTVAHVEDRGRHTKGGVWNHDPMFSTKKYKGVSYFSMTQNVYTFNSDGYAKEVFKNILKAHNKQLGAYDSMMTTYDNEKNKRFDNKIKRKEARKAKVDSDPEKVSKRETKLKELQKKASN